MTSDKKTGKRGSPRGFILGSARFDKISAVEGIKLTGSMRARAREADVKGLSGKERRDAIKDAYRKA